MNAMMFSKGTVGAVKDQPVAVRLLCLVYVDTLGLRRAESKID